MTVQFRRGIIAFAIALGLLGYGFGMGIVFAQSRSKPSGSEFSVLSSLEQTVKDKFDGSIDSSKMLEGAKAGLVAASGDPYTIYLTSDEAKQLSDTLNGTLSGIGAEIGIKNNHLIVVSPLDGSPAQAAGLRPGDIIAAINGKDTQGMTVDQAVLKIRGAAGTTVKLKLVRGLDVFDKTIKRATITVPSVKWSIKRGNIGYIEISQFSPDTGELLNTAASELKKRGAKKYLLDLRNDPGGFLDSAVKVASQFLPEGEVVVEERHGGKTEKRLETMAGGQLIGVPLIVMINGGSASASEIVSGALQDHKAAKLVGEQSFGKGSVQDIINLSGGSELKVTVAHWFTPNGRGIDHQGIKPDIIIKQSVTGDSLKDPQLDKALDLFK